MRTVSYKICHYAVCTSNRICQEARKHGKSLKPMFMLTPQCRQRNKTENCNKKKKF